MTALRTITVERLLRGIAGTFVLLSLLLGWLVHPAFLLFTAFVGANLLQSAFTNACPMKWLLERVGAPSCVAPTPPSGPASPEGHA